MDPENRKIVTEDPGWAKKWEALSAVFGDARHIPGWQAGEYGSQLVEPDYMK